MSLLLLMSIFMIPSFVESWKEMEGNHLLHISHSKTSWQRWSCRNHLNHRWHLWISTGEYLQFQMTTMISSASLVWMIWVRNTILGEISMIRSIPILTVHQFMMSYFRYLCVFFISSHLRYLKCDTVNCCLVFLWTS